MVYRMIFNQTAYFGRGAIKEIPAVAKSHGFTKAFIVTDPILLKTGTVKKVTDVLDEAGLPYEVFDNVKPGRRLPAGYLQGHRHHHRQPGVRRRIVP